MDAQITKPMPDPYIPKDEQFPKYLLIVDGHQGFYPFRSAYRLRNSMFFAVSFGRTVIINEELEARDMTAEDKARIDDAAEEYDSQK